MGPSSHYIEIIIGFIFFFTLRKVQFIKFYIISLISSLFLKCEKCLNTYVIFPSKMYFTKTKAWDISFAKFVWVEKKSAYCIQLHCTINWSNTLFGILIASYAMYCELLFILRVTVTVTDNFNISWYI